MHRQVCTWSQQAILGTVRCNKVRGWHMGSSFPSLETRTDAHKHGTDAAGGWRIAGLLYYCTGAQHRLGRHLLGQVLWSFTNSHWAVTSTPARTEARMLVRDGNTHTQQWLRWAACEMVKMVPSRARLDSQA